MTLSEGDRRTLTMFGLSIVLSAMTFLILPVTIYLGNLPEFVTPIGPMVRLLLIPALTLVLLVVIGGRIAGVAGDDRINAAIAALTLLIWLQAYVLVWDYGVLDGRIIDWGADRWLGYLDLGIWIISLSCAVAFYRRLKRFLFTAVIVLFIGQAAVLAGLVGQNLEDLRTKSLRHGAADTLGEMQSFAPGKNVVHLVLDGFQTDIFKEIISTGAAGQSYNSWLEGFVFFEENIGAFPYTYFSLPAMLSGEVYRNHAPKKEFVKSTFDGKTILNAVHDAGYEIDVASNAAVIDMLTQGPYDNSYVLSENVHLLDKARAQNETAMLIDLASFRLVPHFFKRHVHNDYRWFVQNLLGDAAHLRFAYFADNGFLLNVGRNISTDRPAPVYKFFHLMSTHAPMIVHPDCTYAGTLPRIRETVLAQSRCTLQFVQVLLSSMKERGIYDDALIMIMGDHGGHIPPDRYVPENVRDGPEQYVVNPWTVAMATPLMLVKAPGATGPLKISKAPTSLLDVPATVNHVLGLREKFNGHSVLQDSLPEDRERRFYYYPWRQGDNTRAYILPIQEFIINGSIYESQSWRKGQVMRPLRDGEDSS